MWEITVVDSSSQIFLSWHGRELSDWVLNNNIKLTIIK